MKPLGTNIKGIQKWIRENPIMKYRIEPFDVINDIWLLQKRTLCLFWKPIGVGTKSEVQKTADTLNSACLKIVKEKTLLPPKTGV